MKDSVELEEDFTAWDLKDLPLVMSRFAYPHHLLIMTMLLHFL